MIVLTIASDVFNNEEASITLRLLGGCAGWLAGLLLLQRVRKSQQFVISLLLLTGLALLLFVYTRTGEFHAYRLITVNAGLLTMIISVGFLKIIAAPGFALAGKLPTGRAAFRDTLFTVAVFGSFINISAPVLVADRLSLNRPLTLFACSALTRTFSGCSAWSPFFGGMAVVLTYVEGMRLLPVMTVAFPFAVAGLAYIYFVSVLFSSKDVEKFHGYPMQLSSLWIPAVLAVIVISLNFLLPHLSILVVIALGSLLLTCGALLWQTSLADTGGKLWYFVKHNLPESANELALFLAAGVLATGLAGLVDLGLIQLPISSFGAFNASLLLAAMIVVAMLGIHPVIQIAGLTPLLLVLDPNPQLLALTYMFSWSLGTSASPLSGTHLVMQGRYGIPSWRGAMTNWPFVITLYMVGVVLLYVMASWAGV